MLDGQFGSYVVKNSIPLNVTEIQDAARLADSTVTLITSESASNEGKGSSEKLSDSTEYATMLRNLDAFVDIPYVINDRVGMLMLVPKDRNEPLLFQGQVISNTQYTKNPEDLYASMGRVHMDLSINSKNKTPAQVLLQPEYEVSVSTSFPFTRYLEVSVDGAAWKRVNEPRFRWPLHPGENSVSTRTVCYSGCTTKPASLIVFYGLRKDAREARRRHSPRPESSPPERE
jgi:hypothetical protein